jgi:hypothetical protein
MLGWSTIQAVLLSQEILDRISSVRKMLDNKEVASVFRSWAQLVTDTKTYPNGETVSKAFWKNITLKVNRNPGEPIKGYGHGFAV